MNKDRILESIDKLIVLQTKKLELLIAHKKGLEQLFEKEKQDN